MTEPVLPLSESGNVIGRRHRPHWYRIHLSECVLCWRDDGWRERVYGEPPDDPADRYVHEPDHACEDHFL